VKIGQYYINLADGSTQKVDTLGIQFALINPSDGQKIVFIGLLDSGSSHAVISSTVAKSVGVELYRAVVQNTSSTKHHFASTYFLLFIVLQLLVNLAASWELLSWFHATVKSCYSNILTAHLQQA
jgi:hypothetical protein